LSTENKLYYPWFISRYGQIIGSALRLFFTGVVIWYYDSSQFVVNVLLLGFSVCANIVDVYNLYLMTTKAPIKVKYSEDTIKFEFAFNKQIILDYSDITQIIKDDSLEYLGWSAILFAESKGVRLLLRPKHLINFSKFIDRLRVKNNACVIDESFLNPVVA
jgi:hypothetical protein